MNINIVQQLIDKYKLHPHPEGGWYVQTYKSKGIIPSCSVPVQFPDYRSYSTAIYFLLEKGNFSAFHRIKSDECWHFYSGDPLEIFIMNDSGNINSIILGNGLKESETFQYVVPANTWFASRPAKNSTYCFVGCTVAPGFDFADFELAAADDLIKLSPHFTSFIQQLCR